MRRLGPILLVTWLLTGCQLLGITNVSSPAPKASGSTACPDLADDRASLVGVPFTVRSAVQSGLRGGFVAVKYRKIGCGAELAVVSDCRARGAYTWKRSGRSRDVVLRTEDDLRRRLSLSAVALEPRRASAGALRVDERVAGAFIAPKGLVFHRNALQGAGCDAATHVITAVELGGYVISSGPAAKLDRSKGGFSKPAGKQISRAGDAESCVALDRVARAPTGCDHPLAVRLAPVLDGGPTPPPRPTIEVAGGAFTMGAEGAGPPEGPAHQVTLDPFEIDRTEVTTRAYARCVAEKECKAPGEGPGCNFGKLDRDMHPINCVTHRDAAAFCAWAGKRLPTEAEWERAARGAEGRAFPWGDAWPPPAGAGNLADATGATQNPNWAQVPDLVDGFGTSAPVGTFPKYASASGMLDAVGNVAEWTADHYDPKAYSKGARKNPRGPSRGRARVVRGSSYGHGRPAQVRLTTRAFYVDSRRSQHIGFRCAKALDAP